MAERFSSPDDDVEMRGTTVVDEEIEREESNERTGLESNDDDEDNSNGTDNRMIRPPRPKRQKRGSSTESSNEDEEEDDDDEENGHDESGVSNANPLSSIDNLIHVGKEYQAEIDGASDAISREKDRDESIWDNPDDLSDSRLRHFIGEATGRYRMPIDRALYILQKNDHNFETAISEVARRRELRDLWSDEETNLFSTCFFHFGKRFNKIHAAMPHRTLSSLVQFYYNSKKTQNYKTIIGARLNEHDVHDEILDEINRLETVPAGLCENCNEKSEILMLNSAMKRHECKPCILYFRLMRVPRPASLRVSTERRQRALCPEYMKNYVIDYVELMKPADGDTIKRLGIGRVKEPEDDDCIIVDECSLRKPSPPYIVKTTEDDDPVDSNTCRMTRDFFSDRSRTTVDNVRKPTHLCVPLIWRQNLNKCMEEIEILNDEARRRMYGAMTVIGRVNSQEIRQWKREMAGLRNRTQTGNIAESEPVVATSSRSGKIRHDANWSEQEKRDVVRCFHWYNTDFDCISEVMVTKTSEQVKLFYKENEEVISKSIDSYRREIRGRLQNIRKSE